MNNTKKYDFLFQSKETLVDTREYVTIQAGKGKEDNDSVYINALEFTYIEGLIWDKYREYSLKKKTKITSSDWNRILIGFDHCIKELENYVEGDDLVDVLKFDIFNIQNPIINILDYVQDINLLLQNLHKWISFQTKEEKHIFILKKSN